MIFYRKAKAGDYFRDGDAPPFRRKGDARAHPEFTFGPAFFGGSDLQRYLDADWGERTILHLHGEGANGGTTITDSSFNPKSISRVSVVTSTTDRKFGTACLWFNGSAYATVPYAAEFSPGAGDMTLEMWLQITTTPTTHADIAVTNTAGANGWGLRVSAAMIPSFIGSTTSANAFYASGTTTLSLNTWYHIACVRKSGVMYIFINGVMEGSSANVATQYNTSGPLVLGRNPTNSSWYLTGYIDDLRLTKGFARYVANFPVPTKQSSDDWGDEYFDKVRALLHLDGSNGGSTYLDDSGFGVSFSAIGSGRISTAQAKFGGSSAVFGTTTGNAIRSAAASTNFTAQSAPFTVECWLYPTAYNANGGRIMSAGGGAAAWNSTTGIHWLLQIAASGATAIGLQWWNGSANASIAAALSLNVWTHIEASFDGTTVRLFVNGALANSVASTMASPSTTPVFSIGEIYGEAVTGVQVYTGHVDEVRITKGVARHTAAFTVTPSAFPDEQADPSFQSVVLLLSGDGGNGSTTITDSSVHSRSVTAVGNAQISTAQKKFGSASILLDGTGDYVSTPDSAELELGALDWTIEGWVYFVGYPPSSGGNYKSTLVSKDGSTAGHRSYCCEITGTASSLTGLNFTGFDGDATYTAVTGTQAMSLNTWYHLAFVRSGNLIYLFVNGVLLNSGGTAFTRTLQNGAAPVWIGRNPYTAVPLELNGYVDDIRITKGVARYTAAFTPPQLQLPKT